MALSSLVSLSSQSSLLSSLLISSGFQVFTYAVVGLDWAVYTKYRESLWAYAGKAPPNYWCAHLWVPLFSYKCSPVFVEWHGELGSSPSGRCKAVEKPPHLALIGLHSDWLYGGVREQTGKVITYFIGFRDRKDIISPSGRIDLEWDCAIFLAPLQPSSK